MDTIKTGELVIWRGAWGTEAPRNAVVSRIELCEYERDRGGIEVPEVYVDLLPRCVFSLTNGHWAYGSQIEKIKAPLFDAFADHTHTPE